MLLNIDMEKDWNITASRSFYTALRMETKCPPIIMRKTPFGYYVETKDGKVSLDQVEATNSWDAKTQCIQEWLKVQERNKGGLK